MLAAYLKVPDSILNAAPSDGLFGDEKDDEAQLGATYDEGVGYDSGSSRKI
jgi:NAD+ synthase